MIRVADVDAVACRGDLCEHGSGAGVGALAGDERSELAEDGQRQHLRADVRVIVGRASALATAAASRLRAAGAVSTACSPGVSPSLLGSRFPWRGRRSWSTVGSGAALWIVGTAGAAAGPGATSSGAALVPAGAWSHVDLGKSEKD